MKIFLTGGTGFIGGHFLNFALSKGYEVVALKRPDTYPRIELIQDPQWIDASLDSDLGNQIVGCDVFVHFAAHTPNPPYSSLEDCLYWNVYSPIKLARQALNSGVENFLIAGSCFEYGDP